MKLRHNGCSTVLVVPKEITFQFGQSNRSTVMVLWAQCQDQELSVLIGGAINMLFENNGLLRMINGDLCSGFVPKRVLSPDDQEFESPNRAVLLGDFLLRS